jgi:hypothetical protein
MLDLVAFNAEDDEELLLDSFNSIRSRDRLEIVDDAAQKTEILRHLSEILEVPQGATLQFQNLFRLERDRTHYHIGQCLINFGFSGTSASRGNTPAHRYYFQVIGLGHLTIDLGLTLVRPITWIDRLVGRFIKKTRPVAIEPSFDKHYYVSTNVPGAVGAFFTPSLLAEFVKHDGLLLLGRGSAVVITFNGTLESWHAGAIESIFANCGQLKH